MAEPSPPNSPKCARPSLPVSTDVGDFFAPFFDVAFYRVTKEPGVVQEVSPIDGDTGSLFDFSPADTPEQAAFNERLQGSRSAGELSSDTNIGTSRTRLFAANGQASILDPDRELAQLKNFRASLTLDMKAAEAVKATLVLQPPYEEALKIIDNPTITFGSIMELQWGYLNPAGGGPVISDKGLFTILQPSIKFGREISISISGMDMLARAAKSLDFRCRWDRETYKSDFDIIETLVERSVAGFKIDTSRLKGVIAAGAIADRATPFFREGVRQAALQQVKLFKQKTGDPIMQTMNDWEFFKRLLRENDVDHIITGNTIQLIDIGQATLEEPTYNLLWYKNPESPTDIPMISFESNSIPSHFAAQGSRGVRSIRTDPDTGETIVQENRPEEVEAGENNRSSAIEAGHPKDAVKTSEACVTPFLDPDTTCSFGQIRSHVFEAPNESDSAEQDAKDVRRLSNTRASATIPGTPTIIPHTTIKVLGVGECFGGVYRILNVVHEVGRGYVTKLKLVRSATTGTERGCQDPRTEGRRNDGDVSDTPGGAVPATPGETSAGDTATNSRVTA